MFWIAVQQQWEFWVIVGAMALGVAAALWGAWWLWWRLPKRQVNRLSLRIRDAKARADVEDNFRKTIGGTILQGLGGVAVLAGAYVAYLNFLQQQQATRDQQQAAHDLLISNQVSKGVEQLGSTTIVVRLGGIYALEGLMDTSAQYHKPVLEALCSFVREGTKTDTGDASPAPDIQAALRVIGRRSSGDGLVDLTRAQVRNANLTRADLTRANLNYANLIGATLTLVNLNHADLTRANLNYANLIGATLTLVNLNHADLTGADLTGADLNHANLTGADLSNANLTDANLTDANLANANLANANLTDSNVPQYQLDKACGIKAKLPSGLTLKPCP